MSLQYILSNYENIECSSENFLETINSWFGRKITVTYFGKEDISKLNDAGPDFYDYALKPWIILVHRLMGIEKEWRDYAARLLNRMEIAKSKLVLGEIVPKNEKDEWWKIDPSSHDLERVKKKLLEKGSSYFDNLFYSELENNLQSAFGEFYSVSKFEKDNKIIESVRHIFQHLYEIKKNTSLVELVDKVVVTATPLLALLLPTKNQLQKVPATFKYCLLSPEYTIIQNRRYLELLHQLKSTNRKIQLCVSLKLPYPNIRANEIPHLLSIPDNKKDVKKDNWYFIPYLCPQLAEQHNYALNHLDIKFFEPNPKDDLESFTLLQKAEDDPSTLEKIIGFSIVGSSYKDLYAEARYLIETNRRAANITVSYLEQLSYEESCRKIFNKHLANLPPHCTIKENTSSDTIPWINLLVSPVADSFQKRFFPILAKALYSRKVCKRQWLSI